MTGPAGRLSRRAFLAAAAGAAAAAALAACGGGGGTTPPAPSRSPSSSALGEASKQGLQIGAELPAVTSEAVEGPEIDLTRYRGHPFILSFWASTCGPCVREFPLLKGVIDRHSDLPVVGVNVMDRKENARAFVRDNDATWPSIWDPDGSIAAKFRVRVLPVTYAVGRDFTLVDRLFGELDRNRLDSMVEAILKS